MQAPACTVLTCGQLRLRLPPAAPIPSIRMCPDSAAVELDFRAFSGTVVFEPVPQPPPSAGKHAAHTPPSADIDHGNPNSPLAASPQSTPQLNRSQSQRSPIPQPQHQPLMSHPIHLADPLSLSQPLPSFPVSQPFALSQLPSPSLYSPFPASQLPDMPSSSEPSAPTSHTPPQPAPMADHFARAFMPLSPPSDDDHHLLDTAVYSSQSPPTTKRQAPEHAVKTGKRVRFQADPQVFSPPPLPLSPEPAKDKEKDNLPASEPTPDPAPLAPPRSKPSPWKSMQIDDSGNLPARRWGASFTRLDDDTIVLLGGESERDGFFKEMAVFHVSDSRWLQKGKDTPEMPHGGRAWHSTTCVDSNLFVFGGEKEIKGERTQTNDVLMYDTTYFTWYPPALSGNTPSARGGHCAALLPGTNSIVIYGGINGNKWLNDLHLLQDLAMWSKVRTTAKSARPSARSYASLTPAAGFLVLFGGNNKTKSFNDVHLLKPADLSWSEPVILGRAPRARTGHCAVASKDGKGVVVYGGWDDLGAQRLFYSDVWELRIKSETECQWACLFAGDNACRTPGPRAGAGLTRVGDEGKMLLFGGWHQFTYFNDITELVLPFKKKSKPALAPL